MSMEYGIVYLLTNPRNAWSRKDRNDGTGRY